MKSFFFHFDIYLVHKHLAQNPWLHIRTPSLTTPEKDNSPNHDEANANDANELAG